MKVALTQKSNVDNFWKSLFAKLFARSEVDQVRKLRAEISSGERVKVIQPHREFEGIVLNVRVSTYGPKEVFVQCDRSSFSGWVTIDQILPAAFKSA